MRHGLQTTGELLRIRTNNIGIEEQEQTATAGEAGRSSADMMIGGGGGKLGVRTHAQITAAPPEP